MNGQNKGRSEIMHGDVYLSLGSNIGDRAKYLSGAIEMIKRDIGEIIAESSVYESEPWGKKDQRHFLNQVIVLSTSLKADELLEKIQDIENVLGRVRKEHWGPRTIDIDILFYNNLIINKENLLIPHPRAHERRFIIEPMAELAPLFIHPVLNHNMMDLSRSCADTSKICKVKV